jgi:hypothetical protein
MAGLSEQVIVAGVDRTGRPESPMPATVHPQQILLWVVFIIYREAVGVPSTNDT